MLHNKVQKKKNKITFENDIDLILNSFDIFFKTFECYNGNQSDEQYLKRNKLENIMCMER